MTDAATWAAPIRAPFPYFGGKRLIASAIWQRFGCVRNYVEPFCGSAAVLLAAPAPVPVRTINDLDGFITNFYRAVQHDPDAVARAADWPVNESDLFARHVRLVNQRVPLTQRLQCDPDWYDADIAGWWVWGINAWIGGGWCSGMGPWTVEDGAIVSGRGVNRKLPHLADSGRGVNRKLPNLADSGMGVNRKLPYGVGDRYAFIRDWFRDVCARLRDVRVTCGDWRRVLSPGVTTSHGLTAVLLDPPYNEGAMDYSTGGNQDAALPAAVWQWAVAHGDDPCLRIAVCGYQDGRVVPDGWTAMPWSANKGYQRGAAADTRHREVIWFSPHCEAAL